MRRGEERRNARRFLRGGGPRGREVEYCFLRARVLRGSGERRQRVGGMDGNAPIVQLEQGRTRNVRNRLHGIRRVLRGFASREREKRAQWIHRNDGVVSVLREVDPVGTVHSGLVGDVVAAIHDRGFGVVLRVESIKRAYIFHELVATDREGARLFPICQVFVGYSEFDQ